MSAFPVAIVAVAGVLFTGFVVRKGDGLERARVQSLASTTAAMLEPGQVAALRGGPSDIGSKAFENVRAGLRRAREVNPDFRFVYLMRPRQDAPERLLFLADAEPVDSADYSPPGEAYDGPSDTLLQVFRSGHAAIEAPAHDRWGYWVTAIAPVRDPDTDAVLAVLGMDINADAWLANKARYRTMAIAISGLMTALVLILVLGLQLHYRAATRIAAINEQLEREVAKLERTQKELRLADVVVKHTGEGVVVLDANFRIEAVNPGFERITGLKAKDVQGHTPPLLESPENGADSLAHIRQRLLEVGHWEGTLWTERPGASACPLETSLDLVRDDDGALVRHVMVFRDATVQKQLEQRLRELSATDGLTMVANRRMFDEVLEREWSRALRSGEPISLVMADLDLFKAYNDLYGHVAGDYCLQRVAEAIALCAQRGGDLVARYGGEEFAMILPKTDAATALGIASKVRERVQSLDIIHAGNLAAACVTISLGVATRIPAKGIDAVSLVQSADQALYRAKAGGRNSVAS